MVNTSVPAEIGAKPAPVSIKPGPVPIGPPIKIDPEPEPETCPWSLRQMLGSLYQSDVLGVGSWDVAMENLRKWLANDEALAAEATQMYSQMQLVDKKRNGKDFIVHKQVQYLEQALKE